MLTTDPRLDKAFASVKEYFDKNVTDTGAREVLEEAMKIANPPINRSVNPMSDYITLENFHAGVMIPEKLFLAFVGTFNELLYDGDLPIYTVKDEGYAILVEGNTRDAIVEWLDMMEKLQFQI